MTLTPVPVADLPARPIGSTRVLHTSDWHLGVSVRNEPRDVDHDAVIAEIAKVATAASPDLIVHTGDLFNGGRPAMADFGRAIRALRDLAEVAPVVVLAGNHDSAIALETLGDAVSDVVPAQVADGTYDSFAPCPSPVRVMARPLGANKGAIATYPTAAGGRLRLVGLPFVHANRVAGEWEDTGSSHSTFADGLRKISERLTETAVTDFDPVSDVAVFASHLHIDGARTSTEKEIHTSSQYATDPAHISGVYGYLAFGHIHIAQAVAGGRGRYAGSVLEVDFGEEGETKQVVVADLTPGRPTVITDVALSAGRRIHRVAAPWTLLGEAAATVGGDLVEVTVLAEPDTDDGPDAVPTSGGIPGFDSLAAAVDAAFPDATVVGVLDGRHRFQTAADETPVADDTQTPSEMFRDWLAGLGGQVLAKHPTADPERVAALFDSVHTAVVTESEVDLDELTRVEALTAGDQT